MSERGADNVASTKTLLDLDVDCCECVFEWLALPDLRSLRLTCKRLNKIVDHHIESSYPKAFGIVDKSTVDSAGVHSFAANISKLFKSVRYGDLSDRIEKEKIPIIKDAELVLFPFVTVENDLYQNCLQFCENLRHLCIKYFCFEEFDSTGKRYEWLDQNYPKLEHFTILNNGGALEPLPARQFPELSKLFQENPTIKQFSTDTSILLANQEWIAALDNKLDRFELNLQLYFDADGDLDFRVTQKLHDLLNGLHERQFYKKLHLYMGECDQGSVDRIATLRGLEKLFLFQAPPGFTWPLIPQLKEFSMEDDASRNTGDNLNLFAESFVNVERIYFETASFNSILPFIHRSIKLKQIKITFPNDDEIYCNEGVIDLITLNRERKKCANEQKITIFVNENVYLKTKDVFTDTEFGLIELKRAESYEWDLLITGLYP